MLEQQGKERAGSHHVILIMKKMLEEVAEEQYKK